MHTLAVDDLVGFKSKSDFSIAKIVEDGLPTDSLNLLKDHGLTFTEVGEVVIAPRTLKHRKARGENLSGEESDRALRVARVMALGNEVFGDPAKALKWLRTPSDRLEGRTPLSMLRSEAGGRVVENQLWQIDEGIFG
jgi:putative toxin-antitoxin system antitoxin component (TIGR02293 family)